MRSVLPSGKPTNRSGEALSLSGCGETLKGGEEVVENLFRL
jgi:hypothetical protein